MNADASISERGASRVPWPWVLPIGIYLVGLAGLALYAIVALWPDAGAPGTEAPGPTFLVWPFPRGSEQATLLLVFFAGVLGALVHALRSFYWYVGHRKLIVSWVAMLLPPAARWRGPRVPLLPRLPRRASPGHLGRHLESHRLRRRFRARRHVLRAGHP